MKWTDTRKQRGAEIMFNAPYEFIEFLKQKASYVGVSYSEITRKTMIEWVIIGIIVTMYWFFHSHSGIIY